MIKKLRVKFLLINLFLVTALLAGMFAAMFTLTSRNAEKASLEILAKLLRNSEKTDPKQNGQKDDKKGSEHDYMLMNTFLVKLDDSGKVSKVTGASIAITDAERLNEVVGEILSDPDNSGIISEESLRYLRSDDNTMIAFIARAQEISTLKNLIRTSLWIGSGSLLVLIVISFFLSCLAVKPIERSWEKQKRFIADASHELKTPLTSILAGVDILQSGSEESGKWLGNIKAEALRMSGLVSDLLFLAKTDETENVGEFTTVDLSDAVWSCLLSFESVFFEMNKELQSTVEAGLFVKGNSDRLKQTVMILLDNAAKYSKEASAVSLTLQKMHDKARLTVHNSGAVISPSDIARIFDRFYRADKARAGSESGFGLGLSIAHTIVEAHGGKITAESSAQSGTTFTVQLPLMK